MWTRTTAALAALLGLGCGTDWRIEPCLGETEDTCRVDSLTVDGRERSYLVSRMGGYDCASGDLPLVLVWHGSGGNGAQMRQSLHEAELDLEGAIAGRALLVYPDGLAHSDCFYDRTCWDRDPDGYDLGFFDALVERLAEDYCVDVGRVYSLGHSRGGRFVEVLGCHRADAHAAVASIAAGDDNVEACPGTVPIWLSHGRDDETIPFAEGEGHRDSWAERNGCEPVEDPSLFADDECAPLTGCETPVVWCPSREPRWGGHAMPAWADTAIWDFFSSVR